MILITTRKILTVMVGVLLISTSTQAQTVSFGSGLNQFNMDFVPIGSPGNLADSNSYGAVPYLYQMGTYEVSESMITKASALGSLGLGTNARGENKPATSISWNEAARFVNWLNTSTGGSPAYKFTTGGVNDNIALWTPADTLDYDASNPFRSLRANYVLPSANEWYKAAYYDPEKIGTNKCWDYPTRSDDPPTPTAGSMTTGEAVYSTYDIFGNPIFRPTGPADVNNAGGTSAFGVMGMGGNVWEWEETESDLVNDSVSSDRGIRGGYWNSDSSLLSSLGRNNVVFPTIKNFHWGFRVASLSTIAVPEPSTWAFIGTLTIGLFGWGVKAKRMSC